MNALKSQAYRRVLLAFVFFALAGCATSDFSSWPGSQSERRAENLARTGQFQDAASVYIGLAERAAGRERDRLTMLAVEQWLNAGDERRARNALREVPEPPSGELSWLWTANTAALALLDGQPDNALDLLEPMSRLALPTAYRVRAEALRADAWFQKRDPSLAIRLLTQRELWLDDDSSVLQNRKRLWNGLLVSDLETLRSAAETEFDPEVSVDYTVIRKPSNNRILTRKVDFTDDRKLNFSQRAGGSQYALQLLLPPFWITPDLDKTDQSLFQNFITRMQRVIPQNVKENLTNEQLLAAGAFPYLQSFSDQKTTLFVLFSNFELEEVKERQLGSGEQRPMTWRRVVTSDLKATTKPIGRFFAAQSEFKKYFRNKLYRYVYYSEFDAGDPSKENDILRLTATFAGEGGEESRVWSWTLDPNAMQKAPALLANK